MISRQRKNIRKQKVIENTDLIMEITPRLVSVHTKTPELIVNEQLTQPLIEYEKEK